MNSAEKNAWEHGCYRRRNTLIQGTENEASEEEFLNDGGYDDNWQGRWDDNRLVGIFFDVLYRALFCRCAGDVYQPMEEAGFIKEVTSCVNNAQSHKYVADALEW